MVFGFFGVGGIKKYSAARDIAEIGMANQSR